MLLEHFTFPTHCGQWHARRLILDIIKTNRCRQQPGTVTTRDWPVSINPSLPQPVTFAGWDVHVHTHTHTHTHASTHARTHARTPPPPPPPHTHTRSEKTTRRVFWCRSAVLNRVRPGPARAVWGNQWRAQSNHVIDRNRICDSYRKHCQMPSDERVL